MKDRHDQFISKRFDSSRSGISQRCDVDGLGHEPFRADLMVSKGRVVSIGESPKRSEQTEIDADGFVVAPGFIDVHTHADLLVFLPRDSATLRSASMAQGVTTVIVGYCGFSVFPIYDRRLASEVERHLGTLFGPDTRVFADLKTYTAELRTAGLESNVGVLVGQGTLRAAVVGFDRRAPTQAELDDMRSLAATAFQQGALGLSTGLLYPPGSFAATDEVAALAEVAGRAGKKHLTHMRDEMDKVADALDEAIWVSRNASVPLQVSHLKAAGRANHGKLPDLLERLEQAPGEGPKVGADAYPYERGSTVLHALLPPWATEGGMEATISRSNLPETRARLRHDFASPPPSWQNFIQGGSWDDVTVASAPFSAHREGRTVAEISLAEQADEVEVVADLLISENGSVTVFLEMADRDDVTACLANRQVMVGSDGIPIPGKPHPRWAGSFARVLSTKGRERFGLSISEAVRKMSSYPARPFGLTGRGVIRTEAHADLVVFDEERAEDRATYEEPLLSPIGVEHVVVNGHHVVDGGQCTGRLAGRVLLGVAS